MKFAKYSVMMLSFLSAHVCAGDEYRFSYEKTEQGYCYLVKNQNDKVFASATSPHYVFVPYGSDCEQFKRVIFQLDVHNKDLTSVVEAQGTILGRGVHLIEELNAANQELLKDCAKKEAQLKLRSRIIGALVLGCAGIVECYWWYQWYFGTQQN